MYGDLMYGGLMRDEDPRCKDFIEKRGIRGMYLLEEKSLIERLNQIKNLNNKQINDQIDKLQFLIKEELSPRIQTILFVAILIATMQTEWVFDIQDLYADGILSEVTPNDTIPGNENIEEINHDISLKLKICNDKIQKLDPIIEEMHMMLKRFREIKENTKKRWILLKIKTLKQPILYDVLEIEQDTCLTSVQQQELICQCIDTIDFYDMKRKYQKLITRFLHIQLQSCEDYSIENPNININIFTLLNKINPQNTEEREILEKCLMLNLSKKFEINDGSAEFTWRTRACTGKELLLQLMKEIKKQTITEEKQKAEKLLEIKIEQTITEEKQKAEKLLELQQLLNTNLGKEKKNNTFKKK